MGVRDGAGGLLVGVTVGGTGVGVFERVRVGVSLEVGLGGTAVSVAVAVGVGEAAVGVLVAATTDVGEGCPSPVGVKVGTAITMGTTGVSSGAMSLPALLSTPLGSILAATRLCSVLALESSRTASVALICSCIAAGRLLAMLSKPWNVTFPACEEA